MEVTLNVHGNDKQKQAARLWIDGTTTDIVYGGSKGSGKSFLGCSLILGDALIYPGTHYFIARKKLNDLRKFTIPSIHEVLGIWGIDKRYYSYNGQDNYFEFHNGSKVFLLQAKHEPSDPTYARFGSMQMTRGWIEEAGEFEEEAKNNLAASIGRWKNDDYGLCAKLLQTCNPAKNYLYGEYYKKFKDRCLEAWKAFIQALPSDNKRLSRGYLENLERTLSHNEKERLLYGNWEYDDDPMKLFWDFDKILEMFTNEFVTGDGRKWMTCDIAYEGSDLFVIGLWDGLVLEHVEAIDKIDETQVSRKIHELRISHKVPISHVIYDADGLKTYVKQSARTGNLVGARQFFNNAAPIGKEKYFNLKAQCYFMLAKMVEESRIYVRHQRYRKQIIEELEQIRKRIRNDDNDKVRLEKKEEIRKRLGRSPDFADMLMMRMLPEIAQPKTYQTTTETLNQINY